MMDEIETVVSKCEEYAEELFDGETYYTQITKWQDGDFSIEVHYGKGHERRPYRHRAEVIWYRHWDGAIVYADRSTLIDRQRKEVHEREHLEQYREPREEGDDE